MQIPPPWHFFLEMQNLGVDSATGSVDETRRVLNWLVETYFPTAVMVYVGITVSALAFCMHLQVSKIRQHLILNLSDLESSDSSNSSNHFGRTEAERLLLWAAARAQIYVRLWLVSIWLFIGLQIAATVIMIPMKSSGYGTSESMDVVMSMLQLNRLFARGAGLVGSVQ
ncbi:hypothetical protein HK102_001467, partial [Quaeritorhiza haematococci]